MDSAVGSKLKSLGDVAVLIALAVFIVHVTGKTIQVVSDNISTMAYLNHMGGPSHELNQIANAVWAEAIDNHVSITCCHIAGKKHSIRSPKSPERQSGNSTQNYSTS